MKKFQKKFVLLLIVIFVLSSSVFSQQDPPRWDCCWHIWSAGCNLGWTTSLMYSTQSRQRWAGIPDQTMVDFILTAGESIKAAYQVCSRVNPAWPGWMYKKNYLINLANKFRRRPDSITRNQIHASLKSTYNSFGQSLRVVIIAGRKYNKSTCSEKYYKLGWMLSYAQQTLKISDELRRRGNRKWNLKVIAAKRYIRSSIHILRNFFSLRPVTGRCVNLRSLDLINRMNYLLRLPITVNNLRYKISEVDKMWRQINQQIRRDCFLRGTPGGGQGQSGLTDITVNSRVITVSVWDHGSIDGDRVNVYLNGRLISNNLMLKRNRTNIRLNLSTGSNVVEIKALNEGSQSPNTASMKITNVVQGKSQQKWGLKRGQTGRMRIIVSYQTKVQVNRSASIDSSSKKSPIQKTTEKVTGFWNLGRVGGKPICSINLLMDPSQHVKGSNRIMTVSLSRCIPYVAAWVSQGSSIIFKDGNGQVTFYVKRVKKGYWEGSTVASKGKPSFRIYLTKEDIGVI